MGLAPAKLLEMKSAAGGILCDITFGCQPGAATLPAKYIAHDTSPPPHALAFRRDCDRYP